MKTIGTIIAAMTLTALTLYTLYPSNSTGSSKLLGQSKGFLYDVKVCGTNNYDLDLVSWTNSEEVKSRSNVHMYLKFKSKTLSGTIKSMKVEISKVIPLFSQTYKSDVDFTPGNEATFSLNLVMPLIPVHFTVDTKATLKDESGNDMLTICGKLDI